MLRRGRIHALRVAQLRVDLRQQGKGLAIEFLRSSLPEGLRRRLDVADFGTPVQSITTTQQGDKVRMLVEPVGDWEHSAYQSDNQFVIEVRQKKVDLSKLTQGPNYSGEKLSLNFQNIEFVNTEFSSYFKTHHPSPITHITSPRGPVGCP